MSCRKSKESKYINRKSPPIPADKCKIGTIKKGNDGNKYYVGEVKSKSGKYHKWLKYKNQNISKSSKKVIRKPKETYTQLKCKEDERLKKGYIRKGYITKTGKRSKDVVVKDKCVKKNIKSIKSVKKSNKSVKKSNKSKDNFRPKFVPTKKNKGIGKLKSGELGKHGYSKIKTLSLSNRHNALTKAVDDYGAHMVFRKLGALRTYQKHKNPLVSKLCHNNQKWIRKSFNNHFKGSWKNSKVFNN